MRSFFSLPVVLVITFLPFSIPLMALTEIDINPKIEKVTVYTENALIHRTGKVSLKKGENIVRIPGLSPHMIDNSVQVRLVDPASVKITDVNVKQSYLHKHSGEALEKLRNRLADTEAQIQESSSEIAALSNSIDFIKRQSPFPQNQRISPAELEAHAKFLEKSTTESHNRIAKLETRLKKLREEKTLLEKELARLETPEAVRLVEITLWAENDLKVLELDLSYLTQNARWGSLYTLRADSLSGRIEWDSFVSITQSSGEEWKDAQIEISTAQPFSAAAPDPLEEWTIDVYRPAPRTAAKALSYEMDVMRSYANADKGLPPYAPPAISEETTSFSTLLPALQTIPSDNTPHKIFVASASGKNDFHYRAVPKRSPFAYLSTEAANPFTVPLFSGEMTLLLDGRVVGSYTPSKTLYPGDKTLLSFGIDEGIKIERKQTKKFAKEKGIISPETEVAYDYIHEITNTKNKTLNLSVEDHFPISQNEQIHVRIDAPKAGEATISEEGIVTWDIELKPKAKKSLPLRFSVSYPKEVRVEGLE